MNKTISITTSMLVEMAKRAVKHGLTVRQLAKETGCSKSTIHNHFIKYLPDIDRTLSEEVNELLAHHKAVRHQRGGEATRQRFAREKEEAIA